MNYYKFYSSSLIEAVSQMKNQLGEDAVIISTKRIDSNNVKEKTFLFEIIAAEYNDYVDEELVSNDAKKSEYNGEIYSLKRSEVLFREINYKLTKSDIDDEIIKSILIQLRSYEKFINKENIDDFTVSIIASMLTFPGSKFSDKNNKIALFGNCKSGKTTVAAKMINKLINEKYPHFRYTNVADSNSDLDIEKTKRIFPESTEIKFMNVNDFIFLDENLDPDVFDVVEFENDILSKVDSKSQLNKILKNYSVFLIEKTNSVKNNIELFFDLAKSIDFTGLIFTHLDEISTHGRILNFVLQAQKPISFLSFGSNSNSDLLQADPELTAKLIYSGSIYG